MNVCFHRVNRENWRDALRLEIEPEQQAISQIAPNVRSLAEAYVDTNLRPFLIYPESCRDPEPRCEPVGFVVYEIADSGVGFLLRLMIDRRHQRRGYGRAAILEAIRRLRLCPEVGLIATSHRDQIWPLQSCIAVWDLSLGTFRIGKPRPTARRFLYLSRRDEYGFRRR